VKADFVQASTKFSARTSDDEDQERKQLSSHERDDTVTKQGKGESIIGRKAEITSFALFFPATGCNLNMRYACSASFINSQCDAHARTYVHRAGVECRRIR